MMMKQERFIVADPTKNDSAKIYLRCLNDKLALVNCSDIDFDSHKASILCFRNVLC